MNKKANVYLLISGIETFGIIFIFDYQSHGLLLQMFSINFKTYFPKYYHIMLNIETKIENIVLHLNKTIQYFFCSM